MKVIKCKTPEQSLAKELSSINYTDCYKCTINKLKEDISADDILVKFWTEMPWWINKLLDLRNRLVKIVGLKGKEDGNIETLENAIRNGSDHPLMSISAKSENETVLAMKDKHLTAYLSLYIDKKDDNSSTNDIYTSTLVAFHKPLGYIYFYTIYPFHHLVVKKLLKHTLKKTVTEE
ncbi:DUF2867 domain-containing protein [Paludibacter sp. 221]|uniref:DUF2867 domain-containing protein n=1 Tax=Paludibacter sp. 221 TaxID=2302939 RepID=UPI0013D7613A|nr:DUF2867 domain-containing protein [Paludibacter sp. 221]NDV47033.1 DUF2867 domain-containing protein [Paludibacter sp. 221]